MYTYVRSVKLPDIRGRSAYITNKTGRHKDEDILCVGGPTSDWLPYVHYEKQHQRSSEQNNEGRELTVALPNSWGSFIGKPLLKSRADNLAQKLLGKNSDYQYAVHWNSSHTNLHMHLIYSERIKRSQTNEKAPTSDFYDRDIYLTNDGKIARKKADRAVDEQGNVKPPIHRKGEPKNVDFSAKDTKYKSRAWLQEVKKVISRTFALEADKKHVTNYLHTFHEGKAPAAAERTKAINSSIRAMNKWLDERKKEGYTLKKAGDKVYNELYKRTVGIIDDGTDLDTWFYKNVATNADKVQLKEQKKEERAEKTAERKEAAQRQAAEKVLLNAYNTAIELYGSRVSRDLPYNNLTYDALKEINGSYDKREHPKLEKKFQKLVKQVSELKKTRELMQQLDDYFEKTLSTDGHYRYITVFEEPYTAARKLMSDINRASSEPNVSFTPPPSPKEREERKRENRAAEARHIETLRQRQREKEKDSPKRVQPSPAPEPERSKSRKKDTWSR